jgi:phosphatidate cytidylyltransferase
METVAHPPERQPAVGRSGGELGRRVISAVVLGVVALGAAWAGGPAFLLVCTVAALAVWWEWTGIIAASPRSLVVAIGWVAILGMAASLAMDAPAIALVCAVIGAAVAIATAQPGRTWAGSGVLYAAAALIPAVMLRNDTTFGLVAIFWLFAVVWAEDTGAYFAGRFFGGRKLAPRISPNKTWSGAVGGTLAAIVAGSAVLWLAGVAFRPAHLAIAFVVAVAAQVGDLFESAVKRRFGAKDSSSLIPGHGGVMDRIDGLLIAATVALVLGIARGGPSAPASGLLSSW